jgi:hypothetical protein
MNELAYKIESKQMNVMLNVYESDSQNLLNASRQTSREFQYFNRALDVNPPVYFYTASAGGRVQFYIE